MDKPHNCREIMIEPKVSIIIVNWNGWEDTIECLESVFRNAYSNYDIIVIDNGSQDESIERIKEYAHSKKITESNLDQYPKSSETTTYSEYKYDQSRHFNTGTREDMGNSSAERKFIFIMSDKNNGFAEGNNIAIKCAIEVSDPKYILLLNNDTLVDKFFLTELVQGITSRSDIGIVGPKIYFYDYDGRKDVINYAGANFFLLPSLAKHIGNGEIDIGQYDKILKTDYINGAAFLIDRQVISTIGFLKSDYFLYWEETDFCMRSTKAGYHSYYIPSSKIWHKISRSTNKISHQKTYYYTRNMFWMMKENSNKYQYAHFLVCYFGILVWVRLFQVLYRGGDVKNVYSFLKGIIAGLRGSKV